MAQGKASIPSYKKQMVELLKQRIQKGQALFITQCGGLKNRELEALRTGLRSSRTRYTIVKNSTSGIVLEEMNLKDLKVHLTGQVGFGISDLDPAAACKSLFNFAKEHEALRISAGVVEGHILGEKDLKVLASLPSREVLVAKAAGQILAPSIGIVSSVQAVIQCLVSVLDAISKTLKEETSHVV